MQLVTWSILTLCFLLINIGSGRPKAAAQLKPGKIVTLVLSVYDYVYFAKQKTATAAVVPLSPTLV